MKRTYKNNAPEDVSYFIGNEVEIKKIFTLDELLPSSFGPENLQ